MPRQGLALLACGGALLLAVFYGLGIAPSLWSEDAPWSVRLLRGFQLGVEILAALVCFHALTVSLAYLFARRGRTAAAPPPAPTGQPAPPVGLVYLCCGDLDPGAVRSLLRLRYEGTLHLVIHDDLPGGDPAVDALVAQIRERPGRHVHLLRRADKAGGKPGVLNHVLGATGDRYEFFVLCDNDSTALDPDCLPRLLAPMADPGVAAVQARNVGIGGEETSTVNRVLTRAIDVFHLFLDVASRWGWTPFVGHNGLLRTAVVREVGGFTPGCFADDIDLTARLNHAGYRVAYAGDVPFGERHPSNYRAFRTRTGKWACGSVQVLKRHAGRVLRNRHLTFAEKWGFFQFIGFYALQALMLVYVASLFLVGPFVLGESAFDVRSMIVVGTLVPAVVFMPVFAYRLRHRELRGLPSFVGACWVGYGATDFPTARGVLQGLDRKNRPWVPTNSLGRGGVDRAQIGEAVFGAALLLVPLWKLPVLLLSPLTWVVAGKFLLIPAMGEAYRDDAGHPEDWGAPVLRRLMTAAGLVFLALTAGFVTVPERPQGEEMAPVEVRGSELWCGGAPFVVRGVHYGPWRPGTGPGRSPFPSREDIAADLDHIVELNANAILMYEPPRFALDLARERGLRVLASFWIDWKQIGSEGFEQQLDEQLERIPELADHPALMGWMLGHEIPAWVIGEHGKQKVEGTMEALYERVRELDPDHWVTFGNWPPTRGLDLGFLDVASFNVYALWPPEVAAHGYGNFIADVLQPIAGDRPLLITEYGTNSVEAGLGGQARLTRECWEGLRKAGAVGGFAFEFADEWWKNYSNPRMEGSWWDRVDDMDDHLEHDLDPEEHYGLMTGDRRPKPAYAAVKAMYAGERGGGSVPALVWIVGGAVAGAGLAFVLLYRLRRLPDRQPGHTPQEMTT